MAPEQIEGGRVSPATDVFAFCVSFWEALYGQRPFAGRDFAALAAAIRAGKIITPPSDRRVPSWLRRIVERGLQADPAQRWPSLPALVAELARGRAHAPAGRRRRDVRDRAVGRRGVGVAASLRHAEVRDVTALLARAKNLTAAGKLYFTALEAGALDVAADAATNLVRVVGYRLARPGDGLRWSRHAEAALRTLEPEPGLRSAGRLERHADLLATGGNYAAARGLLEEALVIELMGLVSGRPSPAVGREPGVERGDAG